MYSRGVSPRIPSNPMMSPCPRGICLCSLILISQSAAHLPTSQSVLGLLLGHTLHRVHKPWDMPCSLHSDSDQQKDTTSTTLNHSFHQRSSVTTCCISMYQPDSDTRFNCMHPQQDSASSIISLLSSTFKVGSFFFNVY